MAKKKESFVKFRDQGEGKIISKMTDLLQLNNESATSRVLMRQGERRILDLFEEISNVTHPLKYSEIDYFTTGLNIFLKKKRKEELEKTQ